MLSDQEEDKDRHERVALAPVVEADVLLDLQVCDVAGWPIFYDLKNV